MSVQYSGDAATTRTSLGLGDAATKTTGTASGNIPVLDGSGQIASGVLSNAAVADNAITLAKMAHGTDGELITYDATGAPANVAVGTSGQVLTSGGTGVAPTFQTAAAGGATSLDGLSDATTPATSNYGLGSSCLTAISGGNYNNGQGTKCLQNNSSGSYNTAMGHMAMRFNTTGAANVADGYSAGGSVTTGSNNVFVGYLAGNYDTPLTTGDQNTLIGSYCFPSSASTTYEIVLGNAVKGVGGGYFTFGRDSGASRVYNQFTANASWTRSSDERIKKDIQDNTDCGLDFINDLRPVTYKFKAPSELDSSMSEYDADKTEATHQDKMYGFIAQEVKTAMDNNNITDFAGWHQINDGQDNMQGISYEMFVMPLVKAVQELTAKVTALESEVTALKGV